MEYLSSNEISKKWGISQRRITLLAAEGKIPGARKVANNWLIPVSAEKPLDARFTNNRKINEAATQFVFPIFSFSIDHSEKLQAKLTKDQKKVLKGERWFYANHMNHSYPIFVGLLKTSNDPFVKMSCLYHLAFTTMLQNNFVEFEKYYSELKSCIKKYQVKYPSVKYILKEIELVMKGNVTFGVIEDYDAAIFDNSSFSYMLTLEFYNNSKNNLIGEGNRDLSIYECIVKSSENDGFYFVAQYMHIYLALSYIQFHNEKMANEHLRRALKIAYEKEIYAILSEHYHYFSDYLDKILSEFPAEVRDRIIEGNDLFTSAINGVAKHYSNSKIEELSVLDMQYIAFAIRDIPNKEIAYNLDVSESRVSAKFASLCQKFKARNKEDLVNKLKNCLVNPFLIAGTQSKNKDA